MDDGQYDQLGSKISDVNIIDHFHLSIFFWFQSRKFEPYCCYSYGNVIV